MKRICKYYICFYVIILVSVILLNTYSAHAQEDMAKRLSKKILVVLHPLKSATLSAEVPSVVKKIHHEMGEKFREKEVLIDFDSNFYKADKKKANALLTYAYTVYKTNKKLYNQKSVSDVEFAKAKADLNVAKADLSIASKKLSACSIRAPYSGRVVKLLVKENEIVQQGQPLIEIVNDQIMRAKFHVPLGFNGHLDIGQILNVKVRGINKIFECKITHISPQMESNTSTFQMFAEIDNADNILQGGMTGEIMLTHSKGN
jgi:membrane fusion protein, multidrug efflux system